jgi:hypothetical protein
VWKLALANGGDAVSSRENAGGIARDDGSHQFPEGQIRLRHFQMVLSSNNKLSNGL